MKTTPGRGALLLALLMLCLVPAAPALAQTAAVPPTPAAALTLDALRGGGYVIYFRHGHTDHSQADTDLSRCDRQRNLDAAGRADAAAIGDAFRRLGIPVGRVYASNYCRTRDTARLAFGRVDVVTPLASADERLRQLLGTVPPAGRNTAIVAHGMVISRVAGVTLAEGEAIVFQPRPDGSFRLVARLLPAEWADVAG